MAKYKAVDLNEKQSRMDSEELYSRVVPMKKSNWTPIKFSKTDVKQWRADGWYNLITSLGTSNDKRMFNRVQWENRSQEDWEQLYSGDEIASRIVNKIPEESLRKWVEWTGVEKQEAEKVEEKAGMLDLRGAIERTWKWGRAYGGAVTYIVTPTDDPASPLRIGEQVIGLRDLSRYDLRILTTDIETDFGNPNWGHPRVYYLVVQMGSVYKGYPIHWTRLVRFDGYMVPRRTYIRNNYWHDSELNRLYNVIRNYQSSNDAAASILQDFNVGIYKMKNLANLMEGGKESVAKARIEMLNYAKSTVRAMILDADDEDFVDMARNVTGLSDMLRVQAERLVAAGNIPHTELLGESPDGSNATGNSTKQSWYSHIESQQENYLRPKLKRFVDVIYPDLQGRLKFKFKPLYQLTDLEMADLKLKTAQTDQIYIQEAVVDPTEIAESRFGSDQYSTETKLDLEARAAGLINPGAQDIEGGDDEDPTDPEGGGGAFPTTGAPGQEGKSPAGEVSKKRLANTLAAKDKPGAHDPVRQVAQERGQGTVESGNPGTQFNLRNQQVPAKPKVKPFISFSISEPMRDPETDPKLPAGGIPKKPRHILPEAKGANLVDLGERVYKGIDVDIPTKANSTTGRIKGKDVKKKPYS